MQTSLVLTTYNRSALLRDALESIAASQVADPSSVEVWVVDNNSSDDTADVVRQFQSQGFVFALHYILEREPGVSAARNRGIAQAGGSYVVFMDDDQRIEPNYLARLGDVFAASDAGAVGGPVEYDTTDGVPNWATGLIAEFGQFNAGDRPKTLEPSERLLNGGNIAIRRGVLAQVGGFDTALGRSGENLFADEDQELQHRILAAGYAIFYSPALCQYHYLRPERLTKRYWRRSRFDWGRSKHRQARAQIGKNVPRLLGAPRWFWSSLATREIPRYLRSVTGSGPEQRFARQLDIFAHLGQIHEARATRDAN